MYSYHHTNPLIVIIRARNLMTKKSLKNAPQKSAKMTYNCYYYFVKHIRVCTMQLKCMPSVIDIDEKSNVVKYAV